jgi:signal transduction histidine kinase
VKRLDELVAKVIDENTNLITETGVQLEVRAMDLWPLVESLTHDLHPVAGTSSTSHEKRIPEDMVVHADASLLRRNFQNMIANAIRYTPRGAVEIGARRDEAGDITCWVRDNGSGVPAARLARIFDALESDGHKTDGAGSGLGLAIVKTFVEAHDGTVRVDSVEGQGSTFTFTLPRRS